MLNNVRKAKVAGGVAIAAVLAVAALDRPGQTHAGSTSVSSGQGEVNVMSKHDRHKSSANSQATSSATSSARGSASAQSSATARSSTTSGSGSGQTGCAADAMASAEADGERVTVRDSRRSQDAQDGCQANASAEAGQRRNTGD